MSRALSWRNNPAVWSPIGWVTIWTMRRSRTSKPWQNGQWMTSRAPVFGEAVDVRELVDQTGGGKHPTSDDGVATDELDAEAVVVGAGHATARDRRGPHRRSCGPPHDRSAVSSDGGSPS